MLDQSAQYSGFEGGNGPALGGRLQALEIRDRFGRLRGRGEDSAGIVLHQLQPLREILRMVGARVLRDAKLCAQEG